MLKIDLHTHILPDRWPDLRQKYGYGDWIRLEHAQGPAPCRAKMYRGDQFFREIEANAWDPACRIQDMDKTSVHVQALSTVPVMFSYWAKPQDTLDLSRLLNDHIAGVVAEFPRRFVGLGTIPMQAPDLAARELERCVRELKFPGVQIGTNVNGKNLGEPAVFDILQAAEALNAAVFVHPWEMVQFGNYLSQDGSRAAIDRMDKYWLPWLVGMPAETCLAICSCIFGGVFERLPRLRLCFAHGGGSFPGTIGRIQHGCEVRPDLCHIDNARGPRDYLRHIYVDSLVHDPDALRGIIRLFGADRVALGSDYPFPLGEEHPGRLIESMVDELGKQAVERVLGGTALEFLGVSKSAF